MLGSDWLMVASGFWYGFGKTFTVAATHACFSCQISSAYILATLKHCVFLLLSNPSLQVSWSPFAAHVTPTCLSLPHLSPSCPNFCPLLTLPLPASSSPPLAHLVYRFVSAALAACVRPCAGLGITPTTASAPP